jgi:hypothetical protein
MEKQPELPVSQQCAWKSRHKITTLHYGSSVQGYLSHIRESNKNAYTDAQK